ncbi:TonB-dependent receptor [Sphingobium sp. YR768]|uniref:TonB-dependent receptor n=1 Tax=Sphingobium sp. YR768 TaxID=1884365 RepID=UPI0008D87C92|nr:TonB-dependent receptor [Sphingobium sp. YR768]SES00439.1 iron complex outermembrane recepter protein [Sphingobium sp. YR768]
MPFKIQTSTAIGAVLGALMIGASAPAMAQVEAAAPQESAPQESVSGDIIVTAQRRESTVREVPFSIAAFGGEDLRKTQVFSPTALTQQMPGITVNTSDKSLSIVAIRGNVSTFRTATLDTPVAYFMDDVYYVFNNDLNANFYDIQRVEVLRGPQGTLFGRNVVGGAIAVITNNPEMKEDWYGQVTAGNGAYVRTEGMVNGMLVDDKLGFRASFSTETSNGLIDTPNQKGSYGKTDGVAMRGKLLFQPTDTLKIVLSGDYSYTEGNGGAIGLGIGGVQRIPATFGDFDDGKWTNNDFARSPYRQRLRGGYLRGDLDVLGGTLTAITGYRLNDSHAINDDVPVATVVPVFDRRQVVKNRSFTQEVRFASAPGRFSYVVGAYYLSADVSTTNIFYYSPLPGSAVPASVRRNPDVTNITRVQDGNVRSVAVFGEGTFEVTDRLSLVAGGRYTSDRKKIDYHAFSTTDAGAIPGFGFPGEVLASGGKTWNAFTPRVTLKYEPIDNVNLYATWAKGFKSGGFVDNAYRNPTIPLEPEKAQNYEIGAKTRLFNNMLDFNVALFKQKTKNLQNFSGAGGIAHTYNGTLEMKGWEVESVVRPIDGLRLTGNYTHLIGTYTDLRDPLVNLDYSGNPAKFAPRDSFTLGASYDLAMSNGAKLTPQADFNYSSRISTDDANTLRLYENLHNDTKGRTLNARLNYESADGRWTLGIWGKNLTNNYQIVNADDITAFLAVPGNGTTYWKIFTNTPRTYGLTLSIRP